MTTSHGLSPAMKLRLLEQVISGGCVSKTITLNVQLLELPDESTDVATTLFVPTLNVDPLGGENVTSTISQLSVAVAL